MIFFKPEESVGNQKAVNFRSAVVKVNCTPAFIFGELPVVGLIKICAVKFAKSLIIFAEMSGYPVHDNSNTVFVSSFYKISEVVGFTVTACHRIITSGLITP